MKVKNVTVGLVIVLSFSIASYGTTVYIDVSNSKTVSNPDSHGRYWNVTANLSEGLGLKVTDAVDENNNPTDIDLRLVDDFDGAYRYGTESSSLVDWPGEVTYDQWYVDGRSGHDNHAEMQFEDLVAGQAYEITIYASRIASPDDTRTTKITINGTTKEFDANPEGLVVFNVQADANGKILFAVDPDSSSPTPYAYVGGIKLVTVPEPATIGLIGIGVLGLLNKNR